MRYCRFLDERNNLVCFSIEIHKFLVYNPETAHKLEKKIEDRLMLEDRLIHSKRPKIPFFFYFSLKIEIQLKSKKEDVTSAWSHSQS